MPLISGVRAVHKLGWSNTMNTDTTITLRNPLDMHLHLRDGAMLELVAPLSAASFSGAVIMPNLVPPVDSQERLLAYRERILAACGGLPFEPLMMLFMRPYTEAELEAAKPSLFGIKLYPAGATTNSDAGVKEFSAIEPTLHLMQEMDIPLMVHGETAGFVMDREEEFLPWYDTVAKRFPRLRITMEHITTRAAVELLDRHENLFATVTLQHLVITLDDVAGGLLDPHLFCKPIAKRPEDRAALVRAAVEGHPKLMFGSDSAPHPLEKKECCGCAAGVFTAPLALPRLAQLFAEHGALHRLQDFVSGHAQRIHSILPLPEKTITLRQGEFAIPEAYEADGLRVVPMYAGRTLRWSFA